MIAYVDASVLLRVALAQPDVLPEWPTWSWPRTTTPSLWARRRMACGLSVVSAGERVRGSGVTAGTQMCARSGSCIRRPWVNDISTTSEVTGARLKASTPIASAMALSTAP